MARMNVIFRDDDLLEEIRELVPARQRSEFIEEAVRSRIALLRQERAIRAAFGSWSEQGRLTPEEEIRQSRESWQERRNRLDRSSDG
jgi:predicted transcriptional regulator